MLLFCFFLTGIRAAEDVTEAARFKYELTMVRMTDLADVINNYVIDFGHPPDVQNLAEISDTLSPFYIKVLPLQDAWGNDFIYRVIPSRAPKKTMPHYFYIASAGSDGIFNGFEQRGNWEGAGFDGQDLIISNHRAEFLFSFGPEHKNEHEKYVLEAGNAKRESASKK